MPNHIDKPLSERDANQTLQSAYNDVDATISTNGFVVGKVGNKISVVISTTTVPNDTVTFTYFADFTVQLYQIQAIYTDSSQSQLISVTRIT